MAKGDNNFEKNNKTVVIGEETVEKEVTESEVTKEVKSVTPKVPERTKFELRGNVTIVDGRNVERRQTVMARKPR